MYRQNISIIIPAFNEAKRIHHTLAGIRAYLAKVDMSYELIIVDDGSTDGTPGVVLEHAAGLNYKLLVNEENKGKGYSVRRGMLAATGDYRLFMDADNSVDISHLDQFLSAASQGADVVIGSIKVADNKNIVEHNGWHRRMLGSAANTLIQMLAVPGIQDTQRGFKLFSARAANDIFPRQTIYRFGFDIEVLVIARKYGFKIQELPVVWDNPAGSKVTLRSYLQTFGELFRISGNRILRRYGPGVTSALSAEPQI